MRNNRIFALCYRIAAFILCLVGILSTLGVFIGEFHWKALLYYTVESNILILVMFGYLATKTAFDVKRKGVAGSSSYHERLTAIMMLSIIVTFFIFWVLLAPNFLGPGLFTYSVVQTHAITPALMIADFFIFATPGKMKKRDPWLFAIIPYAYVAQSTILGFSGFRYEAQGSVGGEGKRFPYFFLDFDQVHEMVFLYLLVLTVFFIGLAYIIVWIDWKRAARSKTFNSDADREE
jgi:hypothetical protein